MRRATFVGDFAVRPYECGGRSPLSDFLLAAKAAGMHTLTVELTHPNTPTDGMRGPCTLDTGGLAVFFASEHDLSACDEGEASERDIRIGALQSLSAGTAVHPIAGNREALSALLRHFDGSATAMVRAAKAAAMPRKGVRIDVIRLPDVDGWRDDLGDLWNADERVVRGLMVELADAWMDAGAVFEIRMQTPKFHGGVLARPTLPAFVLRRIGERRGRITLSSGAEEACALCQNFDLACVQLYACGIANWYLPARCGWEAFSLRYNCKKI